MDKKNWLWALAGMGLFLPGMAQALGLGELRVLSAQGEPFRAEISIRSLDPQSRASLSAGLAPASAFAMIDLPEASTLAHWHFTVRNGNRPAILISSPLPLTQPTLKFLVKLDWSGGQLVREYTAYSSASPYAPPSLSVAPSPSGVPATVPAAAASQPARLYHGWSRVNRYGPVPQNSSLYQVARSITRSNAVTLDQVMVALVKANPQAFKAGSPTYLYAGSMLTVPSLAQVQSLRPAQATAWLSSRRGASPAAALATAAKAPTTAHMAAKPAGAATHLVLSSAPAAAVTTSTVSAAPVALGHLQEQDAVLKAENQKLMAAVAALGQRLTAEEGLLASQGARLATLSRNSSSNNLFENLPLLMSLGGNVLLLLLFLWMLGRQKQVERRQREISQRVSTWSAVPRGGDGPQPPAPAVTVSAPAAAVVSPIVESPVTAAPAVTSSPTVGVFQHTVEEPENTPEPYTNAEVDPIEQADLYLTYGKAGQAVAVLNEALDANPRRKELYVKLLDVYVNLDRHEEYLDLAERMRGRFGPHNAAWQEVAAQGARLFPGNPLFAAVEEGATMVTHPDAAEPPAAAVSAQDTPLSALDFHFDRASAEPASAEEESAFSSEEKARLLQSIDEQFRLLEAAESTEKGLDFGAASEPEPVSEASTEKEDGALNPSGLHVLQNEFLSDARSESTASVAETVSTPAESLAAAEPSVHVGVDDWDAVGTKFDLAKAYMEMGDSESARDLLEEVSREGSIAQREEAQQLLRHL